MYRQFTIHVQLEVGKITNHCKLIQNLRYWTTITHSEKKFNKCPRKVYIYSTFFSYIKKMEKRNNCIETTYYENSGKWGTLKHWKTTIYNIITISRFKKKTIMKTQMTVVNENICTVYDNKQPITVKHQEI